LGKFQEADLALRLGYLVRCRYAFVRSTSVFIPTWHFTTPAHTHITENLKPLRCDAGHTRISLAHCRTVPIRRGQPGTGTARPRSWLHRQTISPTLEPLALKTRASRLDFCQPRSIAGAALFQTDQLRGLGEKDRAAGAENYPAARFDPLQNGPHQRLPPADRYFAPAQSRLRRQSDQIMAISSRLGRAGIQSAPIFAHVCH